MCSENIESCFVRGMNRGVFWARGEHEQGERMVKITTLPEICIDAL